MPEPETDDIVVDIATAPSIRRAAAAATGEATLAGIAHRRIAFEAAALEREMTKLAALLSTSPAEVERMRLACIEAAQSRIGFTPAEIAEVAHYGLAGGLSVARVTELLGDHRLGVNRIDAEVRLAMLTPPKRVRWWRRIMPRLTWEARCRWWQFSYAVRAELRDIRRIWF